jgi:hypothetical protein
VTERIDPSMGHTINNDEINHVRSIIAGLHRASPTSRN